MSSNFDNAEFTAREIEDFRAFNATVVDSMVWHPSTSEATRTMVIGNARRAWHKALEWERKRTAQPTPDAVAEHITAMVEGLSHSSIGQEILRTALKPGRRISGPEVEFAEATKRDLHEQLDDIRRAQVASPE